MFFNVSVFIVFILCLVFIGAGILRLIFKNNDNVFISESIILSTGIFSFILFLFAFFKLFYFKYIFSLLIIVGLLSFFYLLINKFFNKYLQLINFDLKIKDRYLIIIGILLLLIFLRCFIPPVFFESIAYHLGLAKNINLSHKIIYNIFAPINLCFFSSQLIFAFLLNTNYIFIKLFVFIFSLCSISVVYNHFNNLKLCAFLLLLLISDISFFYLSALSTPYIFLFVFLLCSYIYTKIFLETLNSSYLLISFLFLGFACSTTYFSIILSIPLLIYNLILIFKNKNTRKIIISLILFIIPLLPYIIILFFNEFAKNYFFIMLKKISIFGPGQNGKNAILKLLFQYSPIYKFRFFNPVIIAGFVSLIFLLIKNYYEKLKLEIFIIIFYILIFLFIPFSNNFCILYLFLINLILIHSLEYFNNKLKILWLSFLIILLSYNCISLYLNPYFKKIELALIITPGETADKLEHRTKFYNFFKLINSEIQNKDRVLLVGEQRHFYLNGIGFISEDNSFPEINHIFSHYKTSEKIYSYLKNKKYNYILINNTLIIQQFKDYKNYNLLFKNKDLFIELRDKYLGFIEDNDDYILYKIK